MVPFGKIIVWSVVFIAQWNEGDDWRSKVTGRLDVLPDDPTLPMPATALGRLDKMIEERVAQEHPELGKPDSAFVTGVIPL